MLKCISTAQARAKCVSAFWAQSGLRPFACKFLSKVALLMSLVTCAISSDRINILFIIILSIIILISIIPQHHHPQPHHPHHPQHHPPAPHHPQHHCLLHHRAQRYHPHHYHDYHHRRRRPRHHHHHHHHHQHDHPQHYPTLSSHSPKLFGASCRGNVFFGYTPNRRNSFLAARIQCFCGLKSQAICRLTLNIPMSWWTSGSHEQYSIPFFPLHDVVAGKSGSR